MKMLILSVLRAAVMLWSVAVFVLILWCAVALSQAPLLLPGERAYDVGMLAASIVLAAPVTVIGTSDRLARSLRTGDLLLGAVVALPVVLLVPLLLAFVLGSVLG
jgi:hypothetical protein